MGGQARLMSGALRKIAGNASKHNCTIIFINQLRQKVGGWVGAWPRPARASSAVEELVGKGYMRTEFRASSLFLFLFLLPACLPAPHPPPQSSAPADPLGPPPPLPAPRRWASSTAAPR